MSPITVAMIAAVAAAGCARNYAPVPASLGPAAVQDVDAAEVTRVELRAEQGELRFEGVDGGSVTYTARVGPARGTLGRAKDCPLSEEEEPVVEARLQGGTLRLGLESSPGEDCVVSWLVRVPRDIEVRARLNAGTIDLANVWGSSELSAGAGTIVVEGARGSLQANVGVGDIHASHAGTRGGSVSLRTDVGEVDLYVDGRKLGRSRAPGAGDHVSLDGTAGNAVRLRVQVGDVVLRLGGAAGS